MVFWVWDAGFTVGGLEVVWAFGFVFVFGICFELEGVGRLLGLWIMV